MRLRDIETKTRKGCLKYLFATLTPKQKTCLNRVICDVKPQYEPGMEGLGGSYYDLSLDKTLEHLIRELNDYDYALT